MFNSRCVSRVPWTMAQIRFEIALAWDDFRPCQDGWNAQKLKEHMETYLQKKASESESEATGGAGGAGWCFVSVLLFFQGTKTDQGTATS